MFRISDILSEASKKRLADIAKEVYATEHRRSSQSKIDKSKTEQREHEVALHR